MSGRSDNKIINSSTLGLKLFLFYRKNKKQYPRYGFQYFGPVSYIKHEGSHPTLFTLRVNEIFYYDEETPAPETFEEGNLTERSAIYYERNPDARAEAIRIHGSSCMVCGFNFENFYGEWGTGYAEVHHIIPLSDTRTNRETNPETDLIVVCSNCHRMIHHFRHHVLTPNELKQKVRQRRAASGKQ
ncbi:MAG: HNH endonuclease [Candidatus Parvarchaeota archaeon]